MTTLGKKFTAAADEIERQTDKLEILRLIAELGLKHAQQESVRWTRPFDSPWSSQVDLWQDMLDEIGRLDIGADKPV